jgi:DNA modification methylase
VCGWTWGSTASQFGRCVERIGKLTYHGDLFDVLPTIDAESIDACVTDPPYGIGFMGREWDTFKPGESRASKGLHPNQRISSNNPNVRGRRRAPAVSPSAIEYNYTLSGLRDFEAWTERWAREVFRVLKPGAYLVVCGAPRSHHRMMCGLEDAGFVVRDCFAWLFGSGFPKNYNLGDGKGTALKPGHEPIALAWKPFKGSIKACHETHGTAALNIDACRVAGTVPSTSRGNSFGRMNDDGWQESVTDFEPHDLGRWPANVLLDEEAAAILDEQTGQLVSGGTPAFRNADKSRNTFGDFKGGESENGIGGSAGGASRFYYVAKPSREERDYGCDGLRASVATVGNLEAAGRDALNPKNYVGGEQARVARGLAPSEPRRNTHPTVKPVELMRWLVKLVTPINGIVLDPFMGSGTTGMACRYEQRRFIGIEREADYVAIAERRIAAVAPLFSQETA